ncbi:MAG: ABC transporter substrate-binding protein [Bryobacteraceae bacterium]|jgi:ABC-type nitrate/sulfonate/bicarbonate transport system substrate-binding protein
MADPSSRSSLERRLRFSVLLTVLLAVFAIGAWWWLRPQPLSGTVRLAAVPTAYYLPLMVAVDQHLFEKHGYKPSLVIFNNNNDMINALLRGDAEVSALGSGGAFALEATSPGRLRLIYGQNGQSYSLLVPRDSKVTSLNDLKGKRIGTWQSPTPKVLLHLILDSRIGSDGFTIMPTEFRFLNQLLRRGDADALFNTDVLTQQALESGDVRILSRNPLEEYIMNPFFNGGGLVLRSLEPRDPKMYQAIIVTMREAIDLISTRPKEVRLSLVTHIGVTQSVAANAPIDQFVQIEEINRAKAQAVADLFYENRILTNQIDVAHLF